MKPCVLFVDDEENVLLGLKRALRDYRRGWEFEFAVGGAEALSLLREFPCDVVVSDMQMPGMSGAELLDEIHRRYPKIARIVLSGNYDQSSTFRLVSGEHQYLAKPCDTELLMNTIEASLQLHSITNDERGIVQAQVDELNRSLDRLSRSLFERGMVSSLEIEEATQEKILSEGLEKIQPMFIQDYDPAVEDELDALFNLKAEDN